MVIFSQNPISWRYFTILRGINQTILGLLARQQQVPYVCIKK